MSMSRCMCGATDCPSCGVAQGTVCSVCQRQYDEDGRCRCDYDDYDGWDDEDDWRCDHD